MIIILTCADSRVIFNQSSHDFWLVDIILFSQTISLFETESERSIKKKKKLKMRIN